MSGTKEAEGHAWIKWENSTIEEFLQRAGNEYRKAKYILCVLHLKTKTRFGFESMYLVVLEGSDLDVEIEDPKRREL